MDKEQLAIARFQDAARLSEHRYKKPIMVTYSGGKDSQVLVALAERAGINFEVVNSHTTADAPETVYFIREQFKAMATQLNISSGGSTETNLAFATGAYS